MKQTKQVELQKLIESHVTNPSVQKHMIELSIQSQQEAVERERSRIFSDVQDVMSGWEQEDIVLVLEAVDPRITQLGKIEPRESEYL